MTLITFVANLQSSLIFNLHVLRKYSLLIMKCRITSSMETFTFVALHLRQLQKLQSRTSLKTTFVVSQVFLSASWGLYILRFCGLWTLDKATYSWPCEKKSC